MRGFECLLRFFVALNKKAFFFSVWVQKFEFVQSQIGAFEVGAL